MRLVLVILSIFIASLPLIGQDLKEFNSVMLRKSNQISPVLTEKQISGSPYLTKQFITGTIIRTDGTTINDIPLRYNIYDRTMQFKRGGTILYIVETHNIKQIILNNKCFIYAPYNAAKKIRLSYFQVLNEGKFQLLKMYNVIYTKSGENLGIRDSSRFEPSSPSYYLRYSDGIANLITSQKKLIKLLQPIPEKIIDYIRENNININDEKEMIDLLKYTNRVMN